MKSHPGDFSDAGGPVIPFSQIDPVALKYLALFPAANIPGAPPMFFRFTYNPTTIVYPTLYPQLKAYGIATNPGNGIDPGNSTENSQAYMVDCIHIFSPTLVGEFKGGYTRLNIATLSANQGTNVSDKFGIPGSDVNKYVSGLLNVSINGYTGTGSCNTFGDCTSVPIYDINMFSRKKAQWSGPKTRTTSTSGPALFGVR